MKYLFFFLTAVAFLSSCVSIGDMDNGTVSPQTETQNESEISSAEEEPQAPPLPRGRLTELPGPDAGVGPVYSLKWSPGGEYLASSGFSEVRIRDGQTGETIRILEGHEGFAWGLSWDPSGTRLASVCQDGFVIIWDAGTGTEVTRISLENDWAYSVSWSGDGKLIAAGTEENRVVVFETETWSKSAELECGASVIAVGWSPDSRRVAAAQWNGEVRLWEDYTDEEFRSFDINSSRRHDANGLVWSPDGSLLAVAYQDGMIRLWDTSSGEMMQGLAGLGGWARGVVWSPDGSMIAGSGERFNLCVWQASDGYQLAKMRLPRYPFWSTDWSPGGFIGLGSGIYTDPEFPGKVRLFSLEIE